MLLTTIHIFLIVSVASGVRINGSSMSILASGSIGQASLTDTADTWSELLLARATLNNVSHVAASDHQAVLAKQRRNALSLDAIPASFFNFSHELHGVEPEVGIGTLEKVNSQVVLTLPSKERCILQTSKQLGSGSFGSVYACVFDSSSSQVAVKFIKKVRENESPKKEFKMQQKVISQYVVEAKEMFMLENGLQWATTDIDGITVPGGETIEANTLCIIMERMPRELFQVIKQARGPDVIMGNEKVTKRIWAMVLVGMMRIHQQGMLFRDLKPENLLCGEGSSKDMIVKITDFGFAASNGRVYRDTVGTPEYLAPEQVKGDPYGASVDAWALGVLLWELYTGWPPFYDDRPLQMFRKIVSGDLPAKDLKAMPEQMKLLVENLLHKDPTKRRCIQQASGCPGLISDHPWVRDTVATLMAAELTDAGIKKRMAERKKIT